MIRWGRNCTENIHIYGTDQPLCRMVENFPCKIAKPGASVLLLGRNRRVRCRRTRTRRQRIDHLAGARVVQFFAGLVFNRVRIVLQPIDMSLQQIVLPLQTMQLPIQALCILPLLLVHRKPVLI
jgi:hypothetical protein